MKRSFIKAVAVLATISVLVCMFAGCGNKINDKDEQGRTIVTVGGWPQQEGKALDNITERKARFEEANPDVVIQGDAWTFDRKSFYAKAAGGQLPILYNVGYTEMPEIINSEYAADLTSVLKKRGYEGKFNENVLDVVSSDGKIYGFPFSSYALGMAFNVKLMEQAGLMEADGTPKQPKDWYEVAEFAVKIKEATGKPGFILPSSGNAGGWMFMPIAWSFGVDFMEKDKDGKWQGQLNSAEAVEALSFIKDLKWKYEVLPNNTLIDLTEYYKAFATGNAGMLIADGGVVTRVVQYAMSPDDLGLMAMPAGPKRHVTLLGGAAYCMSPEATEDQIDAAIRWIETTYTHKLTEEFKINRETTTAEYLAINQLVGVQNLSPWSENAESLEYERKFKESKANSNINHVKLYNDFVIDCPAEIQPEEPVCCQELYTILDSCIQEVFTNKDADCKTILEKANSDFQKNYLDNLTY